MDVEKRIEEIKKGLEAWNKQDPHEQACMECWVDEDDVQFLLDLVEELTNLKKTGFALPDNFFDDYSLEDD